VGATEDTFYALATADGFEVERGVVVTWLSNLGHLNGAIKSDEAAANLHELHVHLRGDETLLASKRAGSTPRLDFVFPARNLVVEVDEIQHFTSERFAILNRYADTSRLAFDVERYRALVERWRDRADRYRAMKPAADFPFPGGRRAQRAYFDACRDLLAPEGEMRVLRVPAPECDGALAFRRFIESLDDLAVVA
jgi:hypothetical protein